VMRVGSQIAEPAMVHLGLSRAEAGERAIELLAAVGVADPRRQARAYPHELSGGLRQRVAIAIALAAEPHFLIADEPASALDVTVQAQLLDLLDGLRLDRGLGVLLITHDLAVVASRADEVAVMYAGRIVEQAPTLELFSDPRHPYTRALLRATPRLSDPPGRRLEAIAGAAPVVRGEIVGCRFAPRCPDVMARCHVDDPALMGGDHRSACWLGVSVGLPGTVARADRRD
jgi:peptide/nickel transport system ATP-binding protein